MSSEGAGHHKLKKAINGILQNCSFDKTDLEVDIDIDSDGRIDFSVDACALYNDTLFTFQCKDRTGIPNIEKEIGSTQHSIAEIVKKNGKVVKTGNDIISSSDLIKVNTVKCCYAFTEKLSNPDVETTLTSAGFYLWNNKVVQYYRRVSDILKGLTKYQLLKEFNIPPSKRQTWEEDAVEIKQGDEYLYLLGIHPGLLLRMAYVYRRTSNKSTAYQRLINKDRLSNIAKFLRSDPLLLANPVIIVFDQDEEIQGKIKYDKAKKSLTFPTAYCSAWIIDGQHRIYGFKDHPQYKDWNPDYGDDKFKLPVVAFKKLPEIEQNKTFVNINYYQKKIDPALFCDLATVIQDLKHEITWPSLLVTELNKNCPWEGLIKISEFDTGKPITISGFSKLILLNTLLGYKKKSNEYHGVLYDLAPFDVNLSFVDNKNQQAFKKQLYILNRFFSVIRSKAEASNRSEDMWLNNTRFGLTKFTCVNALLLVLNALLGKYGDMNIDLPRYLTAIDAVDFNNEKLLRYGRGYPAFTKIANKIIRTMNSRYKTKLGLVGNP